MVRQRSRARAALLSAAVFAALAVASCGGSGGGSSGAAPPGSTKVTMSEFKFDPSSIDVKAGKVTFFLVNSGSQAHDMVVSDSGGKVLAKSDIVQGGNSSDLTVDDLPAGTYTIYCDLPGHRAAGMQGTLTAT
jgi:plastocyanin